MPIGRRHRRPVLAPPSPGESELMRRQRALVEALAGEIGPRHRFRLDALRAAERRIEAALAAVGAEPRAQRFACLGETVANLELRLGGGDGRGVVVVGAHYDTVPSSPGADDNASGVAVLIELARLLADCDLGAELRLVAFVNEEPPFFQTADMGSLRYARRCRARGERVVAMLSLESLGVYSDRPGSQLYPPGLAPFYPSAGDFLAFVGNLASRRLVRRSLTAFRRRVDLPAVGAALPTLVPGIAWSDQWAFWRNGFRALMVTDTAPFRYPHYHGPGDTPERLDYPRLARATLGLAEVVAGYAACHR